MAATAAGDRQPSDRLPANQSFAVCSLAASELDHTRSCDPHGLFRCFVPQIVRMVNRNCVETKRPSLEPVIQSVRCLPLSMRGMLMISLFTFLLCTQRSTMALVIVGLPTASSWATKSSYNHRCTHFVSECRSGLRHGGAIAASSGDHVNNEHRGFQSSSSSPVSSYQRPVDGNGQPRARDEKEWKSGEVFKNQNTQQRNRRRNDPWWMREEEKSNPRVLPPYKPWWADPAGVAHVGDAMKVADLKAECERRGLPANGKKGELLTLLNAATSAYDLSDKGFRSPAFVPLGDVRPSCYPEVYEEKGAALELKTKAFSTFKAPPERNPSFN